MVIKETPTGILLAVYIQTRAAKTEYVGLHGETLKFRVAAPPVDGAANEALCRFLAKLFSVPKPSVHLSTGKTGRRKHVELKGVSLADVQHVLKLSASSN
ncbi:MAG: YggU family protein [Nitrospirales bacterium]|nr:YggU family protein [Nitrospirales bacterium]